MILRRFLRVNRLFPCLLAGAFLNGTTGCSFVTGVTETIPIRTNVPGARIHVDGEPVGTSPADGSPLFVTLKKSKQHYVTATKEGYESNTLSLRTTLSGIGIVDVIGAWIWLLPIIPVVTGHAWTLEPESLYLQLDPLPAPGSPRRP